MAQRSNDRNAARSREGYSLGAVVKLTGLSEHTIRAWERRYGAVKPARTDKGTRRYTQAEVARLRLLHSAVDAGHRIGDLAELSDAEIEERLALLTESAPRPARAEVMEALERLDLPDVERVLGLQLSVLGPELFARELAAPLLREVGDRWERGETTIAAEHLLSSVTRGVLGAALRAGPRRDGAPHIVFTTPEGERHELGVLIAAVTAVGAGARATYLGPDLPVDEVARAAAATGAEAVALSVVTLPLGAVRRYLQELRGRLSEAVSIWVGGAAPIDGVAGVEHLELEDLGRRIAHLQRLPDPQGPKITR